MYEETVPCSCVVGIDQMIYEGSPVLGMEEESSNKKEVGVPNEHH